MDFIFWFLHYWVVSVRAGKWTLSGQPSNLEDETAGGRLLETQQRKHNFPEM